ncbi:MAG: sodium:solute symporter [Actinomycetes bacterium]
MIAVVFFTIIALSIGVAMAARRGGTARGPLATLIAGRSLPGWLIFFLAVGEIYSVGTMLGFPGGIYAKGASYGVWFIGYILLGYIFGYFLAPLVWRAGKAYNAVTVPDVMFGHYGSRALEKLAAFAFVLALLPWAVFQFVGLQTVLSGLGLPLNRFGIIVGSAVIAFLYVAISGMRSTAFVAIVKDLFMFLGITLAGIVAVIAAKGVPGVFEEVVTTRPEMTTVTGGALVFAMSTIFVQSIQFYLTFPAQFLFSAKSEGSIKKSVVWMPSYMLMYPLLVFAAYYGITHAPNLENPDGIFLAVTRDLAPEWIVGLVAAGAGLSALIVLAGNSLMFGGVLTRNLVPAMSKSKSSHGVKLVMGLFLVVTATLSTFTSSIMLTFLNLALALTAQLVPAWFGVMFFRKFTAPALSAGLVVGCAMVTFFYFTKLVPGNVNTGLIALAVNLSVVVVLSMVFKGGRSKHEPVAMRAKEILGSVSEGGNAGEQGADPGQGAEQGPDKDAGKVKVSSGGSIMDGEG